MLGQILENRYEVFYHLGGGGFGQTYLARDMTILECNWYVIKQLKPYIDSLHKTDLEKAQQLFEREIQVLQELGTHNRIPSLLGYFTESGESYLVQEFIDGCVFSEELKQVPIFSEIQILIFLKSVLEILDFVHSKEIIHRDVKPSNLIRRRQDNEFTLIDFGAVKQLISTESNSSTGTRIVTDIYTPREQERGRARLCSDIYALGIVAIQAFLGTMPSIDDDTNEVDWQNQRAASPGFAQILNNMICERPIDRYASASIALAEVNKLINQHEPEIVERATKQPTPYKFDYVNYWYTEANKLRDIYGYHRLAIYLYDKAIEIKPSHWQSWFNRGITLRYLKNYEESAKSFETAISINSGLPKLHFQRGLSLFASENLLEALNSYSLAIQINPLYSVAWFYKGVVLHRLKRDEEADMAYEEAKRLRSSFGRLDFRAL